MPRFIVTLADRRYAIGVVGLLESLCVHTNRRPGCTFVFWFLDSPAQKYPGWQFGPNPSPVTYQLKESVSDEELRARIMEAYPFAVCCSAREIPNLLFAKNVFYMKSAILRASLDDFGSARGGAFLYADCDCLVNNWLDPLWELIEAGFFLLSPDPVSNRVAKQRLQWEEFLGESIYKRPYGCAGMLGFRSSYSSVIRHWEVVTARLTRMLADENYSEEVSSVFGASDQDAINMVTAGQSFPSRNLRMIAPRDMVDFQRDFYDPNEPLPVALSDPLRVERQTPEGTRVSRASIIHCFDKWWHKCCITPVKTLGLTYLQASPVFDCFEYQEGPSRYQGDGS